MLHHEEGVGISLPAEHRAGRHTPLIFPDCVNHLSEKMEQPGFLHGLIRQMEVFADAVAMQPDLMRFRFLLAEGHSPPSQGFGIGAEGVLPDARTDGGGFGKAERAELKRGRSAETPAASPAFFS